jgi:hypothetical protein
MRIVGNNGLVRSKTNAPYSLLKYQYKEEFMYTVRNTFTSARFLIQVQGEELLLLETFLSGCGGGKDLIQINTNCGEYWFGATVKVSP